MVSVAIVIAVIVGLVEAIKRTGLLDSKYSALLAVFIGVLWFLILGEGDMGMRVFEGVIAGLSSVGLYAGAKATVR